MICIRGSEIALCFHTQGNRRIRNHMRTTENSTNYLLSSSLLLVLLLCALPVRAVEYQINGTLTFDLKPSPPNQPRVFPPTLFSLTVSNNVWNLRSVELTEQLKESDIPEGARNKLGPETVKSMLQRRYIHKNVTSTGKEVHSVWFQSITNGALEAEPDPSDPSSIMASVATGNQPPHGDPRSLFLWEALASFPVLNLSKEGHLPQPWHVQPHPGIADTEETQVSMRSSVTRMSGEPRLPNTITFTSQSGEVVGKYGVIEHTNLHGMMIPTQFSLEIFEYNAFTGTADTNSVWITMSAKVFVSEHSKGFNFTPSIPSGSKIADFRFGEKKKQSGLFYDPKGQWLKTNSVLVNGPL